MSGLMRSFKYAAFRAARVIGVCLLMAVGFVFYFAFLDGSPFTVQNLLLRFLFMLLFVGNLMFMIFGMLDVATYSQLTLAYGSTRKNVAISTVFMHVIQITALVLLMAISGAFIPEEWLPIPCSTFCLLAAGFFLFCSGFALIMGILIHRFGKVAYILATILSTLGGGLIGGLTGLHGGSSAVLDVLLSILNLNVMVVVGLIWYAVMAVIHWLAIRKIEVRV